MDLSDRQKAELILIGRLQFSEHTIHVVDCGRLGSVIVEREPEDSGWHFTWLAWTQMTTLNVPGLDLPPVVELSGKDFRTLMNLVKEYRIEK